MAEFDKNSANTQRAIRIGAVVGVIVALLLILATSMGWIGAIFIGIIVAVAVIVYLLFIAGGDAAEPDMSASQPRSVGKPAAASSDDAPAPAAAASTTPASLHSAPPAAEPAKEPSKELKGQTEVAELKSDQKSGETKKKETKPAASVDAATESAPTLYDKPQGAADDLKLISGVGPKLEETLNGLGIWHFDQVAKWGKSEIAWVDSRLRFKGRIERDDWMSQAKTLAAGGETEFSRKKKKS